MNYKYDDLVDSFYNGSPEKMEEILKARPQLAKKFKTARDSTMLMEVITEAFDMYDSDIGDEAEEYVRILIKYGAPVDRQDNESMTALMTASKGLYKITDMLLKTGMSHPEYQDNKGRTALMYAIIPWSYVNIENRKKTIKVLLESGENLCILCKNNDGKTALDLASYHGREPIKDLIQGYITSPFQKKIATQLLRPGRYRSSALYEELYPKEANDCTTTFNRKSLYPLAKQLVTNLSKGEASQFISSYGEQFDIKHLCGGYGIRQVTAGLLEKECDVQELIDISKKIVARMTLSHLCEFVGTLTKNFSWY